MGRLRFLILLLPLFFNRASAQSFIYQKYWIQFTDKNNNPFSLSNPQAFLSQRAIERRQRQNIAYDDKDLPVTPAYADSISSMMDVTLLYRSKWLNSVTVFMIDTTPLNKIRKFSFVKKISAVGGKAPYVGQTENEPATIRKPAFREEYDTLNYGGGDNQVNMLQGRALHDRGLRGQGIVITMLDAGFYNADKMGVFDSLREDNRILGTRDFVKPHNNVYNEDTHGCECLSTMAANQPGNLVGTATGASYWLLRTEDAASEYPIEELNWAAGAEFADSVGTDIISSSLGYTTFDDPVFNNTYANMNGHTTPATIAAVIAASKGIVVCSSAGNEGIAPWHFISSPADADSILTVGAVNADGTLAPFSSRGPTADGRIKPDVVTQGNGAAIINPFDGGLIPGSGTSFSNPIMAGMTACLWQAHRDKTNMQIINAIKQSASFSRFPNNDYGWGIPNFALADLLLTGTDLQNFDADSQPIIFPNPMRENATIVYNAVANGNIILSYYDMLGRLLRQQNYGVAKGVNQVFPDFSNIHAGSYIIKIDANESSKIVRLVKI